MESVGEELAWNLFMSELSYLFGFDNKGVKWWFQLVSGTEEVRVSVLFYEYGEDVLALDISELELCSR